MPVDHISNVSSQIHNASQPQKQTFKASQNSESKDSQKKKAMKYAIGATALAAVVIGGILLMRKSKGKESVKDMVKKGEEAAEEIIDKGKKTAEETAENISEKVSSSSSVAAGGKTSENASDAAKEITESNIEAAPVRTKAPRKKKLNNDFGKSTDGLLKDSQGNVLPKPILLDSAEGEKIIKNGVLEKIVQKNNKGVVVKEIITDSTGKTVSIIKNYDDTGKPILSINYLGDGKTVHSMTLFENGLQVKFIDYWEDGKTVKQISEYVKKSLSKQSGFYEDGKSYSFIDEYFVNDNPALRVKSKETKFKRTKTGSVRESEAIYSSSRGRFIKRDYFADDGVTVIRTEKTE